MGRAVHRLPLSAARAPGGVSFDRTEIRLLLRLYGRRVESGEWRDYALSADGRHAVFSAFRSSLAMPACTIEKLARGGFCLWRRDRGRLETRSFAELLAALEQGPRRIAGA